MTIEQLYDMAQNNNIHIYDMEFDECISMSVPDNIAIDTRKIKTSADLVDKLSHELGHCCTHSFYNINNNLDIRAKHEYHADRWKLDAIFPLSAFIDAVSKGITEVWQLAEEYELNYDFAQWAVEYYKNNFDIEKLIAEV